MILSICIPYLPEPKSLAHYANIRALLDPQLTDEVEIVTDDRSRHVPTGTKRNDMYAKALGQYVCSVDCDDEVSSVYVSEILKYIKDGFPDCVTFQGWMTTNGGARVDWIIKLGEKYEARQDSDGITRYYRFPNHLVPIKKEIAISVKFPDIHQGEDYRWAFPIHERKLIKTSNHIPLQLYHYKFLTGK